MSRSKLSIGHRQLNDALDNDVDDWEKLLGLSERELLQRTLDEGSMRMNFSEGSLYGRTSGGCSEHLGPGTDRSIPKAMAMSN